MFRFYVLYTCFLLAAYPFNAKAQVEKESLQSGLLLRGKAFGFVIIEDWWITSITAGLEYRFAKHHSFGADFVFFKHRYEQEQYNYPNDPSKYDEVSSHNPRQGLLLDYRFYIEPKWISKRKFIPYLNVFYYFGTANQYNASTWEYSEGDIIRQKEHFYDMGATLGFRFCLGHKINLDMSMGAAQRHKTEDVEYYTLTGLKRFEDLKSVKDIFIWRLNLSYYLFSKQYQSQKAAN